MRPIVKKLLASTLLLAPLLCHPPVSSAQGRNAQQAEAAESADAPATGRTEHAYGQDPLQRLDFWRARAKDPAPLVIFVHGGGWMRGDKSTATGLHKVAHFKRDGYAFASLNYRLVPAATVEQQAADVASGIAWLREHAGELGIDPARIVLMGHSAGAQLVALVGTDPQYMVAAGLSLKDIRGVVTLDGACYDVPRQIREGGPAMHDTYITAFGSEPARQRKLSATLQAASPNAPAFLIAHIDRPDGKAQSEALAAALVQAGTPAQVLSAGGQGMRGHREINRALGTPGFAATATVDTWLQDLLRTR
jgi:acetyl esterase/lipase